MATTSTNCQPTTGLAAEPDRAGVLVFTYPDHMTAEQRERAAARMTTQWVTLVAGAGAGASAERAAAEDVGGRVPGRDVPLSGQASP